MADEEYETGNENMDTETEESDSDSSSSSSSSTSSNSSSSSSSSTISSNYEPVKKITLKAQKDGRARGKWKLLTKKKKGFQKEWMDMYPWVEEDPNNTLVSYCKVCNVKMKSIKNILDAHEKSKRHTRNVNPPDTVEEPKKEEKTTEHKQIPIGLDQITDEQIAFFAESQADAAHQAVTSIIDKLVEKYHENRLLNLKVQNEAKLRLNVERSRLIRSENQRKLERRLQKESYKKEAEEVQLKFLQQQHEIKLRAMEDERDAKLRAVEQELVFAKQEYEKKVRLLDSQLSSMK